MFKINFEQGMDNFIYFTNLFCSYSIFSLPSLFSTLISNLGFNLNLQLMVIFILVLLFYYY
jgi:hypothetical protein